MRPIRYRIYSLCTPPECHPLRWFIRHRLPAPATISECVFAVALHCPKYKVLVASIFWGCSSTAALPVALRSAAVPLRSTWLDHCAPDQLYWPCPLTGLYAAGYPTTCWCYNLEIEVEQRLLVTKAILFRKKPKVGRGREDERMGG